MTVDEYRELLYDSIGKRNLGKDTMNEDDPVLTLTGPSVGLGARGYLLCVNPKGESVRSFTRAECRRMLRKLDGREIPTS